MSKTPLPWEGAYPRLESREQETERERAAAQKVARQWAKSMRQQGERSDVESTKGEKHQGDRDHGVEGRSGEQQAESREADSCAADSCAANSHAVELYRETQAMDTRESLRKARARERPRGDRGGAAGATRDEDSEALLRIGPGFRVSEWRIGDWTVSDGQDEVSIDETLIDETLIDVDREAITTEGTESDAEAAVREDLERVMGIRLQPTQVRPYAPGSRDSTSYAPNKAATRERTLQGRHVGSDTRAAGIRAADTRAGGGRRHRYAFTARRPDIDCFVQADLEAGVVWVAGGAIDHEDPVCFSETFTSSDLLQAVRTRVQEAEDRENLEWGDARSEATLRAYRSDWSHFEAWCQSTFRRGLPASTGTIARYVEACADDVKPSTMERRLSAINVRHNLDGHPRPAQRSEYPLSEVWRRYIRHAGTEQKQVAAATPEILQLFLEGAARAAGDIEGAGSSDAAERPLIEARDRTMMLLAFGGALRVSELVGLAWMDLRFDPDGVDLRLRDAKTDTDRSGQRVYVVRTGGDICPVKELEAWRRRLEAEGAETRGDHPVLRPVGPWGQLKDRALSRKAVAQRVKAWAKAVETELATYGYAPEDFSTHSFRAGAVTWMGRAGVDEHRAMRHTRHTSIEVFRRYRREGERTHREQHPMRDVTIGPDMAIGPEKRADPEKNVNPKESS